MEDANFLIKCHCIHWKVDYWIKVPKFWAGFKLQVQSRLVKKSLLNFKLLLDTCTGQVNIYTSLSI